MAKYRIVKYEKDGQYHIQKKMFFSKNWKTIQLWYTKDSAIEYFVRCGGKLSPIEIVVSDE